MENLKKVLVLFCGGTIVMRKNNDGKLEPPEKEADSIQILKDLEPKINQLADVEIIFVENIDSTNLEPIVWTKLSNIIKEKYDNYDGFVVTHGTDTMAYTSSALSFSLKNLGKPVVLTGSQLPAEELETDARRNYINAIKLATKDVSGVYVVFDERIIWGARATKVSESELDAFRTVNAPTIGKIQLDIVMSKDTPKRHNRDFYIMSKFEKDIMIITLSPGSDDTDISFLLKNDRIKGIIIQGFGIGNIPDKYEKVFKTAHTKKIPVIIKTQCINGKTIFGNYEVGSSLSKYNVIQSYDMSLEATATKLMWVLDNYKYDNVKIEMEKEIIRELNKNYYK